MSDQLPVPPAGGASPRGRLWATFRGLPRWNQGLLRVVVAPLLVVLLVSCSAPVTVQEAGIEAPTTDARWRVTNIVDGDTLDVRHDDGTEERVRVVGIDTPERGECAFGEASVALADLVMGERVDLVAGAQDDRDRYDRLLRYVDVGDTDAGLELLRLGLAIARYDSRDGYGEHPREDVYIAADAAMPNITCEP